MALFQTLKDNFNDNSFDTAKWSRTSATVVVEQSSQLQFVMPNSNGSWSLNSVNTYDLTASYGLYQLVTNPLGSNAQLEFSLLKDANNLYQWYVDSVDIYAYKRVTGTYSALFHTAYDSSTHKFFRIRESGGNILWDTSADGLSWTNRATLATPFDSTALSVEIKGLNQFGGGAQTFIIDNFNDVAGISPSASLSPSASQSPSLSPSSSISASPSPSSSTSPSTSLSPSISPSSSVSPSSSYSPSASVSPSPSAAFTPTTTNIVVQQQEAIEVRAVQSTPDELQIVD